MNTNFRQRLEAAYDAWAASGGTTPAAFHDLMDDGIEFHSALDRAFPTDRLSGPFNGKPAMISYWTAVAENWQLLSSRTEAVVEEGDKVVWIGRAKWRNRQTLRELSTPRVDVWTVWQGRAIRCLQMIDSASYGRAAGLTDPPPPSA